MSGFSRHFLGWDQPLLPLAAKWLLTHAHTHNLSTPSPIANEINLSQLLVLVPGSRAGRTLATLLIDLANQRGKLVSLPIITTPGQFIDRLFAVESNDASPLVEHLAWAHALHQIPSNISHNLAGKSLHNQPHTTLLTYAALLSRAAQSLAGDDLLVHEVPARVESAPASSRTDAFAATFAPHQWQAFASVQDAAESLLSAHSTAPLTIRSLRRLRQVRAASPATKRPALLIGAIEIPALVRRALTQHTLHTTALIAAPSTLSERFTPWGTLAPLSSWFPSLPITDDLVTIASSPLDQAEAALGHIASESESRCAAQLPPLTPADVVIAVPDLEVAAALQGLASEVQTVHPLRVRLADPIPLTCTGPAALALACIEFTSHRTLKNLILLTHQPDATRAINAPLDPSARNTWSLVLDEYASATPDRGLDCATQELWPSSHSNRQSNILTQLLTAVDSWLQPLIAITDAHPAPEFCAALRQVLAHAYQGRSANRSASGSLSDVASLKSLNQILTDLSQLPPSLSLATSQARTVLATEIRSATIAPEPDGQAIELLGWLDAIADPAPHLILTGINDHRIPGPPSIDPLLPESLRTLLGLSTSRDRGVRDGYLLDLALHSRRTHLICGRRSQKGDPLLPSRLLLQDDATLPKRILSMQSGTPLPITLTRRVTSSAQDYFPTRPIDSLAPLPSSMSVTSFAAYLRSPYGYYLNHVLGLKDLSSPQPELSRLTFGSLIHDALHFWAQSPSRHSANQRDIALSLHEGLHRASQGLIGTACRVEVELQILIARERLEHFSHWQAARRAAGWEILHSEWLPTDSSASIEVPGQPPMLLKGRIDRIEINRTGPTPQFAILDYKTSDSAQRPDNPHQVRGKLADFTPYHDLNHDGTLAPRPPWKNLQLPLYRHLAASIIPTNASLSLGIIHLPRDPRDTGLSELLITTQVLTSADAAARWVIRSIRARHFEDAGNHPPTDSTSALLSGVGLFSARAASAKTSETSGGDS